MTLAYPIGYAIGQPIGYPVGYGSDRPRNYNYRTTPTDKSLSVVVISPTVTREVAE